MGEQILAHGRTLSYADDALVHQQSQEWEEIAGKFQTELNHIGGWCGEAEAVINLTKAAVTRFSLNNQTVNTPATTESLCSEFVVKTHALKYLGVQFNNMEQATSVILLQSYCS